MIKHFSLLEPVQVSFESSLILVLLYKSFIINAFKKIIQPDAVFYILLHYIKYKKTIINLLITTFMKKILNYLFVLCLLVGAYGCSDDDRDVKRIYPEEKQEPFERENLKGYLRYDNSLKRWIIYPVDEPEFRTGDEDSISFFFENMKDEYKAYEGDVTFSGTLLYLYYEARLPITGCHGGTYIYSLHLKDIQKREPAESPY